MLHLIIKPTLMSEIQQTENKKKKPGVRRSKKLSTRIDLTPMVDLGFLLITFFVFTTTISEPKAMDLRLPKDTIDSMTTISSKTISLLLGVNDMLYYYSGDSVKNMRPTNYSASGLRDIIINKKTAVEKKFGDANETVVLIKPMDDASYKNVIDALDEMLVNNISRYVMVDASADELTFAKNN